MAGPVRFTSPGRGPEARTGWAIFNGSSPRDLRLLDHGTVAAPGGVDGELAGRYPVAGADFDGVLYQGTYSEDNGAVSNRSCGGDTWCVGGPLVGWQYSTDRGKTWVVPPGLSSSRNVFQQVRRRLRVPSLRGLDSRIFCYFFCFFGGGRSPPQTASHDVFFLSARVYRLLVGHCNPMVCDSRL